MIRSEEGTDQGVDLNAWPDSPVQCSICLELVETDEARSKAKLQCGHEFHLDCIGSAFNMKGIMQCPNCRNVEKGQWLYANGSATLASDFSTDSWVAEQYPFFLVPYGFRICPFRGLMEMDDLSNSGHAYYGQHDNFGGQVIPSSTGLAYFTHFRPHPHASLNPNDPVNGSHMIETSHQSTLNLSAGGEHQYSSSQRPSVGTGISSSPMAIHQNPDRNVNAFGGIQGPHPFSPHPRPISMPLPFPPSARRSNGPRSFPASMPAAQAYDPRARFYYPPHPSTGYNLQVTQNSMPNAWGRGGHLPVVPFRHR